MELSKLEKGALALFQAVQCRGQDRPAPTWQDFQKLPYATRAGYLDGASWVLKAVGVRS